MKVYLPTTSFVSNSGIGRAIKQQSENLKLANIEVVDNVKDADIVHINFYSGKFYRDIKKAKKLGKKVVVHAHSTKEDTAHSFRCWRLILPFAVHNFMRCYKKGDVLITPTEYSKSLLLKYKGLENKTIYPVSNGINLEKYKIENADFSGFEKLVDYHEGDKIVIGIGFPFERKGIVEFFETARKMPEVKFIWFGHLPYLAKPMWINRAIRRRPKNVLMPGYVDSSIIKAALYKSSCFFFPSHEETEGIVVLEALATKTPLIINDIGCYDDWLAHGVNCYKGHNVDEFVELLNKVFTSDNKKLVEEGYKVAIERSNRDTTKQIIEIYKTLLNE